MTKKFDAANAEKLYQLYPRKVGHLAALKAIQKAEKEKGFGFLLEAVKAYALAVSKWPLRDRQYIPHPATWFNQGRYDDDRATWQRNGKGRPAPQLSAPLTPEQINRNQEISRRIIAAGERREGEPQRIGAILPQASGKFVRV